MLSDSQGRPIGIGRVVGNPQIVNLSSNTARSTILKPFTLYTIYSDVDGWFVFGGVAVDATASSNPIKAGLDRTYRTDETNRYLAGIITGGSGKLYISEIEP